MNDNKPKSIQTQIVELLYAKGSMPIKQMLETIPYPYKSVHTKALELRQLGLADKDGDGVWSLREGVSPQTLVTGEIEGAAGAGEAPGPEASAEKPAPITRAKGIALDQRGMFIGHMTSIGVVPKEAIPTIADIFFSGDIENLQWLNHVLTREAAGYVTPSQRRLMMSWWANTRKLPYDEADFQWPEGAEPSWGRTSKGEKGKAAVPVKPLDVGQGWKVGKDRAGDWVALPGGPMTYQDAVEAAERRALIASYGVPSAEAEGEEPTEEQEGAPRRAGARPRESLYEKMFLRMFDSVLEGGRGRGDGESETVKKLTERIEDMEKERTDERMERMEGAIASIAGRDPWDEYERIEKMKERLGVGAPVVTDQSPAVQLIKDTTDKLDKNVQRIAGIVERVALRGGEFAPEETRNPEQREGKAGELLSETQTRERSRGLRHNTFGV